MVTLKVDGKIFFQGVLIRGRSESWKAKEKMELSLSNAGAVELIGEKIKMVSADPWGRRMGSKGKCIAMKKKRLSRQCLQWSNWTLNFLWLMLDNFFGEQILPGRLCLPWKPAMRLLKPGLALTMQFALAPGGGG